MIIGLDLPDCNLIRVQFVFLDRLINGVPFFLGFINYLGVEVCAKLAPGAFYHF